MLCLKSPGKGIISPHEIKSYYGKVLNNSVNKEQYITKYNFEDIIEVADWENFEYSNNWGFKCRFHDFETYDTLPAPVVEFHCSQNDLDIDFKPVNNP